ncbi:MAG: hypothetical protein PQJ61_12225 [Spirochaetales bacterium]|uniref:Outer membrane protein beta-barrel domain-containing protein n=1 Tax=Candidatus Thalassospirochaeta sargassi TaxID=3119039 RepID=A0AAJ1MKB6_9SPIO|nr:hypothetical protein [Spirochaetales bacterium]
MLKKLILLLVMSILLVFNASAEDESAFEEFDNALGGFYGDIGGTGLSWQHWSGKLGVQTSAGLWYLDNIYTSYDESWSEDDVDVEMFNYNIGVEIMYMVYEDSYSDWFDGCLYVFGGAKHIGKIVDTYSYKLEIVEPDDGGDPYNTYPTTGSTGPRYVPAFAVGFGFGFEPVFFDHFSFPVEFGIGSEWEFDSWLPVDAGLKFQGGLRYRY